MELESSSCELDMKHQAKLTQMFSQFNSELSEYNFSNLYLFRYVHKYKLVDLFKGKYSFIKGETYDGQSHLMPLFDLKDISEHLLIMVLEKYDCLYPISQKCLETLNKEIFSFTHHRSDSDYIFSSENFIHYRGSRLSKRKNLMNQYNSMGCTEVFKLTSSRVSDAKCVLDEWQHEKNKALTDTDFLPCLEALNELDNLDIEGFIHYLDGKPCGFILIKELKINICVIQFAKGLRSTNGVYQAMFHDLAKRSSGRFTHFNFEQDLGNTNFRKNKMSYQPEILLDKYRVSLR